ncbi:carotenoid 1,2-hydratase [Vibrio sp. JC009]|uniref:lipocalin-like domain-containing protein n=1 Tax=Vibrio sp. JC009 TaxID=2912314 RepID=UPI0023B1F1B6|nr:lipocalin-like domain-containing protein [Vibrio sp. JC009]WED22989.1 carotenoid 1,2-hydratase [Vibrio sp. JC009]
MTLLKKHKITMFAVLFALLAGAGLRYAFMTEHSDSFTEQKAIVQVDPKAVFEPVLPDKAVTLPEDFTFHPEYQHELWQYTANVKDRQGRHYGIEWTVSRIAADDRVDSGWRNSQLYLANIVITSKSKVWRQQRVARGGIGQAGLRPRPFRLWLDNWVWRSIGSMPLPGLLSVETDNFTVSLSSTAMGPYILSGDKGYIKKHDLMPVASYGVKAPFLSVSGQLKLDGKTVSVSGKGWLEKEWGSDPETLQPSRSVKFSLRTAPGQILSVERVQINNHGSYTNGQLAESSGKVVTLKDSDIELTPKEYYSLSNGELLPLKWSVRIPRYNIDLVVKPVRTDLWHPFMIPQWEGPVYEEASGLIIGYLQLSGN